MDIVVNTPRSLAYNKGGYHVVFIIIYLELACHDEQTGGQSFNLWARITELWQFKAQKVEKVQEDDCLAIFKPGLLRIGFFGCGKEWYHFQQQLVVSKVIVKLFS